jgi:hypothetical protein
MMERFDDNGNKTGEGYNDWRMGHFEARKDCVMDQFHASKADTMREIGKTYAREVFEGNFAAYCIANDPAYPYYVVEWMGEPWEAECDQRISLGIEEFVVHKGDWLCKGVWLEKLDGARNWLTTTINMQECVVRLETVVNANLEMRGTSNNNPLPKRLKRNSVLIAKDRGAWRISDDDHAFLIEESRNRECGNEFDEEDMGY